MIVAFIKDSTRWVNWKLTPTKRPITFTIPKVDYFNCQVDYFANLQNPCTKIFNNYPRFLEITQYYVILLVELLEIQNNEHTFHSNHVRHLKALWRVRRRPGTVNTGRRQTPTVATATMTKSERTHKGSRIKVKRNSAMRGTGWDA